MKVFLLWIMPLFAGAQTFFKMDMDILSVTPAGCHEDVTVHWGARADTLFFMFDTTVPVTLVLWQNFDKTNDPNIDWWNRQIYNATDKLFYLTDVEDNRWLVRLVQTADGIVIFINNITDRRYGYLIDFTPNKICR